MRWLWRLPHVRAIDVSRFSSKLTGRFNRLIVWDNTSQDECDSIYKATHTRIFDGPLIFVAAQAENPQSTTDSLPSSSVIAGGGGGMQAATGSRLVANTQRLFFFVDAMFGTTHPRIHYYWKSALKSFLYPSTGTLKWKMWENCNILHPTFDRLRNECRPAVA
jgi:hypothetical protein